MMSFKGTQRQVTCNDSRHKDWSEACPFLTSAGALDVLSTEVIGEISRLHYFLKVRGLPVALSIGSRR